MLDPTIKLGTSTPRADPSGDYAWDAFRKAETIKPGAFAALEKKALKLVGFAGAPTAPPGRSVYATLLADGKHLTTDIITSFAVLLGVGLVAITHLPWLDPVVALLAGVNIMWTGFKLIRDSVNSLMDYALPEAEATALNEILDENTTPEVSFHAVRTRVAGNRHFAAFHVLVPGNWTVKHGHDVTEDLIDEIVARLPNLRVDAHLEPREDPRSYEDLEI
jgi:cation diffusion facilitator family transporter